ncbi:unnamed protein product [Adineta steineri]|uniref:Uncharacterized protein n=1 Tax=Adineta steineri TaxID=433720 RepID=A0A813XCH3_9BILA|nr:unnamed protein product [Adineta steineri]
MLEDDEEDREINAGDKLDYGYLEFEYTSQISELEELKANIVENSRAPDKTHQEQAQHIFELEIVERIIL